MKIAEKNKNLIYKISIILLLLIILAEVCFWGVRLLSHNKNFMNAILLATTVKPETFTELYFENHLNLPSKIKSDQTYSFSFTIHNLENKKMAYLYEVYLQGKGNSVKLPIDQNRVTIKKNQYKTIHETFSINAPIVRSEIIVNLINKNQQIDFWVTDETPATTKTTKTVTPQIKKPISTPTPAPLPVFFVRPVSLTASSSSATTKQYGGWYWNSAANKAMVWLGKDNNGQDIWSNSIPK